MKARMISTQTTVKEGFIPHPNYGVVKGMYGYWETKKTKMAVEQRPDSVL